MEQLYAHISEDAGEGDILQAYTVIGWRGRPIPGTRTKFQRPIAEGLLAAGLVAVAMATIPAGGTIRGANVTLDDQGQAVQAGTIVTAAELAAEQAAAETEHKNQLRETMLALHPELGTIFDGFLLICHIVNGLEITTGECKMGFPELINVKSGFATLLAEQQAEILGRAAEFGYDVSEPAEALSTMAGDLMALDVWGKRYDIMHPELAAIGGWWEICEYIG